MAGYEKSMLDFGACLDIPANTGLLSLVSLPELVFLILETGFIEQHDLFMSCQIEIFRDIATRLLYKDPTLKNPHTFLSTILRKAKLRGYVISVTVPCYSEKAPENMPLYKEVISRIPCHPDEKTLWLHTLERGEQQAIIALLLAHLPKLEHVTVYPRIRPRITTLPENVLSDLAISQSISALKTVSLQVVASHSQLERLLKIPTLQALSLHDAPLHAIGPSIAQDCSNVETIVSYKNPMEMVTLSQIVLACPRLKHFSFNAPITINFSPLGCRYNYNPDIPALFRLLMSRKDSLEYLHLRYIPKPRVYAPTPHSLSDFVCLRRITCDASVLLYQPPGTPLSTVLPRGIEMLQIHNIFQDFMEHFHGDASIRADLTRMENGAPKFPQLCEVRLIQGYTTDTVSLYNCIEGGIKFSLEMAEDF